MTIDCHDPGFRELLPDLAHGRLDAADRARTEAHVAGCEACGRELGIVRAARAALSRTPAIDTGRIVAALPPAPARAPLRVERGGAAAGRAPTRRGWRAPSVAMRIAAGIAALAVGGAGFRVALDRGDAPLQQSVVAAGEQPVVPAATPASPAAAPGTREPSGAAVASASPAATSPAGPASRGAAGAVPGMTFGGGVSDLSDEALHALLDDLEDLDAVPSAEPESDLLPVGLEEG